MHSVALKIFFNKGMPKIRGPEAYCTSIIYYFSNIEPIMSNIEIKNFQGY